MIRFEDRFFWFVLERGKVVHFWVFLVVVGFGGFVSLVGWFCIFFFFFSFFFEKKIQHKMMVMLKLTHCFTAFSVICVGRSLRPG